MFTTYMKSSVVLAFTALSFVSVAAQAASSIPTNPTIISLLVSGPGENFSSQFGHINMRFSYGKNLDDNKDLVVGFGPQLGVTNPLDYFGKAKMINWNQTMHDSLQDDTMQKMIYVDNLRLNLSEKERFEIATAVSNTMNDTLLTYNAFLRNCSTLIADILHKHGNLPDPILAFLPSKLGNSTRRYAVSTKRYESTVSAKLAIIEKHKDILKKVFTLVNANQAIFLAKNLPMDFNLLKDPKAQAERNAQNTVKDIAILQKQLTSRHTEFRLMGYQKLSLHPELQRMAKEMMTFESGSRKAYITQALGRDPVHTVENLQKLDYRDKSPIVITATSTQAKLYSNLPQFASAAGKTSHQKRRARTWDFRQLNISETTGLRFKADVVETQYNGSRAAAFWVTPHLGLDPD